MAVHLSTEGFKRRKARDVERHDEVSRIAGIDIVVVEIKHVTSEGRAVERPRQQSEYQCETTALVRADRCEQAFGAARRIGERAAILLADHPTFWHFPAL